MKKIRSIAKAGSLYSLKLRCGRFALLQTLSTFSRVAVFGAFREEDDWKDYPADENQVIFFFSTIRNLFQNDSIRCCGVAKSKFDLKFPTQRIASSSGSEKILLWQGTPDEREMIFDRAELSIEHISCTEGKYHYSYQAIGLLDYDKVCHLELARLRGYPEINERLALCAEAGRNVDPLKEILFRRPLPLEYRRYSDIIGGKVLLSDLGY